MNKRTYDVVIVGAGINGLTCGCYLAKAGLKVAILEKRNECGPFALTEDIFGAGTITDTHAAACFLPMGPAWGDLELDRFGFDLIVGEASSAITWKDGKNTVFYYRPDRMQQEIARHSQKDAKTFAGIVQQVLPDLPDVLQRAVFSSPSPEGEDYLFSLGKYAGFSEKELRNLNGLEAIDQLYESEYVKMTMLGVADIGLFGDPTEKGQGAIASVIGPMVLAIGTPRGGMHTLVHALVRCFKFHGGHLFLNAPVGRVDLGNGTGKHVILSEAAPYPQKEFVAKEAVVLHVSPPVALPMLGEERVKAKDPALFEKMRSWEMTGHCAFISHFLVKDLPVWKSESWNRDIHYVPFLLRAWDSWDHAKASLQLAHEGKTMDVLGDVGELYNQGGQDLTRRSPQGYATVAAEFEYPVLLEPYGGFAKWDDKELIGQVHQAHLEMFEALAPGFKNLVVDSLYYTPLDNWRRNASALYGHELGGDATGKQWYQGRMPAKTSIPGLYFSNGIWPASLTHLGNGYVAACEVARDLGVRNQPWWKYKPMEYFIQKYAGRVG